METIARPVDRNGFLANKGDVLLIRPLVAHASNNSRPDTPLHRRILQLEFSGMPELGEGVAWHDFLPTKSRGFV
jgi:hypothetical protein